MNFENYISTYTKSSAAYLGWLPICRIEVNLKFEGKYKKKCL